ncbi:MAG: hypothetical protein WCF26_20135 [Candidatus Sulfotelmatobacter sp.]
MAEAASSTSFMMESIPVQRWRLYVLRFLLLFGIPSVVAAVFELPRATEVRMLVEGFALALAMSVVSGWMERRPTDG